MVALQVEEPPLLLRIPVDGPSWAEALPPVPAGLHVTAAFSDDDTLAEHGDAVDLLGYEVVGAHHEDGVDVPRRLDLLVPRRALDRWPLWRDELLTAGGRVFDTAMGPVARLLGPTLAIHDRPGSDGIAERTG